MVPHLFTALSGPLLALERRMLDLSPQIERWFRLEWQEHAPPFYCSVDLRNAGFKLAPVDTNLYPGGFNNLSADVLPLAVQAAMAVIEKHCPDARNLLLIPENHTRNAYYLQNVARLQAILRQTGLTVRLGSLNPDLTAPTRVELPGGGSLLLEPLRRKSNHFDAYNDVAKRFARQIDVDPWTINPYFARCGRVDFQSSEGIDCVAGAVEQLLRQIRSKYREYGVADKPFVIVKADAGTYGMGVMSVRDPAELAHLNRRQRNKMAVGKEGLEVSEVMIQEGVPTMETVEGAVAEPVVYMIDKYVVGGFYRVHSERGPDENLNAPGMHFVPLPFAASCNLPDATAQPGYAPNRFYGYGVVARLALLAASIELERTDPDQSRYG
jgi:glutamate--cysteine ligase